MRRFVRISCRIGILGVVALALLVGVKASKRQPQIWLPAYLQWEFGQARPAPSPTDVVFVLVDHFEPGKHADRVERWVSEYPALFGDIRDSDGQPPRHTWAYPAEQFQLDQLQKLSKLVEQGYGEIELHLHHRGDTSQSLREKIRRAKADFGAVGALKNADGTAQFAFVHGNWALDNSVAEYCGVTDELKILAEEGAFADFTFPAYGSPGQPRTLNSLYYALDDPQKPKSYDQGTPLQAGQPPPDHGFLIFEGPFVVRWFGFRGRLYPFVDAGQLEGDEAGYPGLDRFENWIAAAIHVRGRPEWLFIKTHTHGGATRDMSLVLGRQMADFYRDAVTFTQKKGIRIHFATAREAYNIAKAAEAGRGGNAGDYRNFLIPHYASAGESHPQPTK